MKKPILGFAAVCVMMVLTACSGSGLEGTWVADAKALVGNEVAEFDKCEMLFTFDDDKLNISLDCSGTSGQEAMSMDLGFSMGVEGKYTQDGDKLTLDFSKATPKVDIYKFKINADEKTSKVLETLGMDEKTMKTQVQEQMEKLDLAGGLGNKGELTIKSLEGDDLILVSEGKEMAFKRK